MKPREVWRWTTSGVVLDRELDGVEERVWVNPHLPPPPERAPYGLYVEVLCGFESLVTMNQGLAIMDEHFHHDSLLAAVRRRDDSSRLLVYSAAREPTVHDRYLRVRSILRPTAIGLRIFPEPDWESFLALLEASDPTAREPRAIP